MRRLLVLIVVLVVGAGLVSQASAASGILGRLTRVSGRSPFADCTKDDVPGQPGTNYLHSEVEPWIDVNPTNPDNLAGNYQQDRWSDGGARGLVAGVSMDGGVTWRKVVIPKISLCSGGTPRNGGDYERATDPWLSFAPNGDLYSASLSFDGSTADNAILVSKSIDGGRTWGNPITILKDTSPQFFNDKEAVTADPTDAQFAYMVWDRIGGLSQNRVGMPENLARPTEPHAQPAYFSRTANGGQSWSPARAITGVSTVANQIVVLPDGTLINYFTEISGPFFVSLIRSTNQGQTWTTTPVRIATFSSVGVRDPRDGFPVRTGDIVPDIAVDSDDGTLYAVWQDGRFSGGQIDEVAFSQSTDGGMTWSTPVKINFTPTNIPIGNRQAFTPSVAVAKDGTVGVTYYDFRRNDGGIPLETDYWLIHCHHGSNCTNRNNWSEVRVTNRAFDMRKAPNARGFFVGDYEGLAGLGRRFAIFYAESRDRDPGNIFFRELLGQ